MRTTTKLGLLGIFLALTSSCAFEGSVVDRDSNAQSNMPSTSQSSQHLPSPTGLRVSEPYVFWDAVPNAQGYSVRIDGEEYLTGREFYALEGEPEGNHSFSVKALGDGSRFVSSPYSNVVQHSFSRATESSGYYSQFEELTKQESYLGYGFDVIRSSVFSDKHVLLSNPIFKHEELLKQRLLKVDSKHSHINEVTSDSMETFMSQWNAALNVDVDWGGQRIGGSVDVSATYSGGSSKSQSKHFHCMIFDEQKFYIVLQSGLSTYRNILYPDFEAALYDPTISPSSLFLHYGTHFITSAVMGGRIYSHYLLSSEEKQDLTDIAAKISVEVRHMKTNVNVDASGGYMSQAEAKNVTIKNSIEVAGGADFKLLNDTQISENYLDWVKSLDDHASLIGIKDASSLYPIWDLIDPSKDSASYTWSDRNGMSHRGTRSQQLQAYFEQYGIENYNNLMSSSGIAEIKSVQRIDKVLVNGGAANPSTGYFEAIAGANNKFSVAVYPADADYTLSIALSKPCDWASITKDNDLYIEPDCPDGQIIEVAITAGSVSQIVKLQAAHYYTCTFNSRLGSPVSPQTMLKYGDFIVEPSKPTREGYVFEGWYTSMDYIEGSKWDFNRNYVTGDMVLYARWIRADETITISFNSNGGTSIQSLQIPYGGTISELPTPTKDGYLFLGWFEDELFNRPVTTSTVFYAAATLFAKWTEDLTSQVVITFDVNGGSAVPGLVIDRGTALPYFPVTKKENYLFGGWYFDSKFTKKVDSDYVFQSSATLYARWVDVPWTLKLSDSAEKESTWYYLAWVSYTFDLTGWLPDCDNLSEKFLKVSTSFEAMAVSYEAEPTYKLKIYTLDESGAKNTAVEKSLSIKLKSYSSFAFSDLLVPAGNKLVIYISGSAGFDKGVHFNVKNLSLSADCFD